ncbi:MAG: ATP-binding cassette domain-containing protein [Chitinivibrionales bacterium]|nr:ATP-binding cassette domain-containing protein [Chitinivibrionales bacterium]
MAFLELQEIRKSFHKGEREVHALRGVDLSINRGDFCAIVGPSGSGKTTLLNIVGCLDTPTSGTMEYDHRPLGALTDKELSWYRRDNIGFIFQSYNLIPVLTVKENVELPMVIEKKLSKAAMARKAREIIDAVGLASMAHRLPREISGGQEQRVAIARALVKDPLVVLADEPTANLDTVTAEEIIALMQKINRERQTTFVFSTHDLRMQKHAQREVVLKDGLITSDERR